MSVKWKIIPGPRPRIVMDMPNISPMNDAILVAEAPAWLDQEDRAEQDRFLKEIVDDHNARLAAQA